ncbi:Bet v1-like protein [Hesseltinella vesiculosa]|uniref:Bet v1-like protein n=1 Tax=Hesseltinella vesiculosa TaxID=101127 RepID=A0A1X2GJ83_9FUNG|nr:Bet v1-like protein [Hesseltinella vesiculosa]
MPILESTNRHADFNRKKLAEIKDLTGDLAGWEFSQEKDGVKLYSKQVEGSSIPLVRGDYILKNTDFTAQQVATVATLPGCRAIWDEKFHSAEVREMFTRWESLFWVRTNTPWPVSNRDVSGCNLRDFTTDLSYVAMASVQDDLVPEVSGCVRGNLITSGWKCEKVEDGILIVYVSQIDLAGSIPTSFLRSVQMQMPLCAGKVAEYTAAYGFPPVALDSSCVYKLESFDHAKRTHTLQLDGQGHIQYQFSSKMYPNGVQIKTSTGSSQVEGNIITVSDINGPTTVVISKA